MCMADQTGSFFSRILGLFFSSNDPEAEKRRQLKVLAKALSKNRYKWYRPGSEEALVAMGKFFYEVYKVVGSAQIVLANANTSMVLKNVLVEMTLSPKQKELKERLTEEAIKERAKSTPIRELAELVNNEISTFMGGFDSEKINKIDALYSQLELMVNFVSFDYYFLLKKFDSRIPERTFTYTPKFEHIRGEYVLEDLKDFAAVMYSLPLDADWAKIFAVVKAYREVDAVSIGHWNKLMNILGEVRRSEIIEQIICHLDKNPDYIVKPETVTIRIVDNYLQKMKTQTEMCVFQIKQEKKNTKASELLKSIFGTEAVVRLKNYAERNNAAFEKKMLGGYLYVEELNYLKAFLIDYFKRDIRAITDLFLVRGKWSAASLTVAYSQSFHELLEISDKITSFDDSLAEDDELGTKLRVLLTRADRDKEVIKQLRPQLKEVNDMALKLLTDGTQHFIVIARNLKGILEDFEKSPHALLTNWKELEMHADRPIKEWVVEVYKKIYAFVMLMQLYLKGE